MNAINENTQLAEPHLVMLRDASGISDEVLHARGYRTVTKKSELKQRGFSDTQCNAPALLIPVWNVHGEIRLYQSRPDMPRIVDGKPIKYETMAKSQMVVDVPPLARQWLNDPKRPLFITEGMKKADSAVSRGLCCVDLLGVWNFRGTNEHGGKTMLPDWEHIALNGRTVYIVYDSDVMEKQSVHQALERIKNALEARHAQVRIIYLPSGDGGAKVGLDDFFVAGHGVDDLLALATTELRPVGANDESESQSSQTQSQATRLVELGRAAELWHTPEGDAYGSYVIGAHIETSKLTGRGFKEWLEWKFYNLEKRPPTAQGMNEALGVLSGVARFDGVERRIYTRVAEHAGTIYIDLCDPEWRIVAITSEGWSIVEAKDAPVRFRRAKGMLALPEPVAGGDISELRNFVNVRDDADFTLLSAWLVAALRGGAPNFPVLSLTGEQGSAKSTTARVLRFLVDPNQAALRSEQRNGWDLAIAASNSWCIALDNLSALPLWLSDALCRVSTGGGFATRAHYENDEETIFDATRPILLNGIEDIAARADLLDRAIVLHLPTIPEHARRDESAFWMEFAAARPRLFGVLCDAVATAQRNLASVRLERLPRMADFAKWATAAESALGCAAGGFLTAYVGNRKAANDLALEASPVASALISLMDERNGEPLTITLKSLLKTLNDKLDDVKNLPGGWPKDARGMSGALARCAPTLRAAGWDVQDAGLDPKSRQARRTIAPLENSCFHPSHPSHPSQDSKNAGESAKDSPKDESLAPFATTLSFAHPSQESPAKTDVSKDAKGAKDEMQTSSDAPLENGAESSLSGHNQSDCGYEELEEIAERAAIMEFDGGLSSEEAEQFALNQEREF